jgi:hypothetical protein
MSGSTRWLVLAAVLGLCTSYVLWGLPRTPDGSAHIPATTAATTPAPGTGATPVPPVRPTKLTLDPEEIDFGIVPLNESRTAAQRVSNPTDKSIGIRELHGSCGCLTVTSTGTEIPPGGSITLNYKFAATSGKKSLINAYFRSNEPSDPYTVINLHATVKQEIVLDPDSLNFGPVGKNEPKTMDFVVRSDDGKPFEIRSIAGSRQEYTFTWEPGGGVDRSGYRVHATFKSKKGGTLNDTAAVFTDRAVNGTMPLYLQASVKPDLTCDPPNVAAKADAARVVPPFVTVMKRTTPGKLEIMSVEEESKPPYKLPVEFNVEQLSEDSCRLTIRFKAPYPHRQPFGAFLIKTNVEEQEFRLAFHVNGVLK